MTTILLLFIFGIVLLVLDLFVPGIILSTAGTLAFLAGTARAFTEYGIGGGLLAFAIGAVLLTVALYIEYWVLPKTRIGKKFFLHAAVDGTSQAPLAQSSALSGREALALTPLMPSGQIEIDGQRYEALSLDGHVATGARLRVTGQQNFSLTVTKLP
ncbi:MAG: membrane-bound serine protease (ClpP class) [Verrucomicrobia bacterium]|jgi:membrane-bound ClpP family serine protease|nr:MAG: membrane-bound serine protease (ClpP class) [Verrucomicrobiota bacterium]